MAVNIKVETSFRLDNSSRAGEGNASREKPLPGCGVFSRNNSSFFQFIYRLTLLNTLGFCSLSAIEEAAGKPTFPRRSGISRVSSRVALIFRHCDVRIIGERLRAKGSRKG
jgi:hypothetical protein